MASVELHPAAVWTCDHCGRDHFIRLVERNEESTTEKLCLHVPTMVRCPDCTREFEVEFVDVEEDDNGE